MQLNNNRNLLMTRMRMNRTSRRISLMIRGKNQINLIRIHPMNSLKVRQKSDRETL